MRDIGMEGSPYEYKSIASSSLCTAAVVVELFNENYSKSNETITKYTFTLTHNFANTCVYCKMIIPNMFLYVLAIFMSNMVCSYTLSDAHDAVNQPHHVTVVINHWTKNQSLKNKIKLLKVVKA